MTLSDVFILYVLLVHKISRSPAAHPVCIFGSDEYELCLACARSACDHQLKDVVKQCMHAHLVLFAQMDDGRLSAASAYARPDLRWQIQQEVSQRGL